MAPIFRRRAKRLSGMPRETVCTWCRRFIPILCVAAPLTHSSCYALRPQSTEAPSYALSFAAGTVVCTNSSNTRADGMATRVPDADALDIIRKGASRIVQVTDDEVARAIRYLWTDTHNLA